MSLASSRIDAFLHHPAVAPRAEQILAERRLAVCRRTDRMLGWLLGIEYVAGIAAALVISPLAWAGATSQIHIHIWAAILLGGAIVSLPIVLAVRRPGEALTRHVIAAAQMMMSALYIHLSGGRIETHFHVFGSLAFLAFYRDWHVLITAAVVVAADHLLRGIYWPQSVFGTLVASHWRWLEHAGWVIFEVFFLRLACLEHLKEMRQDASQKAQLEQSHRAIEDEVEHRTADLQRKNRELDEFAYVASHDLQEPVRKLISFSKLLSQDVGETLNDRAKKDLQFIVEAATRMRVLIQDLLALSRTGRAAMNVQTVSLDDCVSQALEALDLRIRESNAQIERDALPEVLADKTLLTQLYQNLLGNALKFTPAGREPHIRLSAARREGAWELAVEDNGIGIKSEYVERIFKPFQRLHGRGEYEGTGIGLAICRKAIERHGGEIWVESEPGEGSRFKFTIPIHPENLACPPVPTTKADSL